MNRNWTLVLATVVGGLVGLAIGLTREADPPLIGICAIVGTVGAIKLYSWKG